MKIKPIDNSKGRITNSVVPPRSMLEDKSKLKDQSQQSPQNDTKSILQKKLKVQIPGAHDVKSRNDLRIPNSTF